MLDAGPAMSPAGGRSTVTQTGPHAPTTVGQVPPQRDDALVRNADRLRRAGARLLYGVVADTGGILRAKVVPAARIEAFAAAGMGVSPTWPVFCVDKVLAMTDSLNVVGDLRLTADLERSVVLDEGFGWAPADLRTQDGARSSLCWRDVARRQRDLLAARGITVRAGYEAELTVLDRAGRRFGDDLGWSPYGLAPASSLSTFLTAVVERLDAAGAAPEQVHAEYGDGQVELSLPPADPVHAADFVLLARTVIGRVAREQGLLVSFSPMPFAGGTGNGAHLHVSFRRDGAPLLSGGPGPGGLTEAGGHLLAGILRGLPQSMAVLGGSVVSPDRLQPDHWSGPYTCWGVENREAALRLVVSGVGSPHGANIEVRCVDAAANPYLAAGITLGLAADGLEHRRALPAPVGVNPSTLSPSAAVASGVHRLPVSNEESLHAFERGREVRRILGPALHAAVVAVRRHEQEAFSDGRSDRHAVTRYAWSA
jgi:glutamine synthetase